MTHSNPACRARGIKIVSGTGFTVDDVYLTTLEPTVWLPTGDLVKVTWKVEMKPRALEDLLWDAFLPDVRVGPRMRVNRRINGAFRIYPLEIGQGSFEVPPADPETHSVAAREQLERSGDIADKPRPNPPLQPSRSRITTWTAMMPLRYGSTTAFAARHWTRNSSSALLASTLFW